MLCWLTKGEPIEPGAGVVLRETEGSFVKPSGRSFHCCMLADRDGGGMVGVEVEPRGGGAKGAAA